MDSLMKVHFREHTHIWFQLPMKIVLNYVEDTIDVHNRLNSKQHACRKGSSCDSAFSDMADEIESGIYPNQCASRGKGKDPTRLLPSHEQVMRLVHTNPSQTNKQCQNNILPLTVTT